jgi:hypothetical protein
MKRVLMITSVVFCVCMLTVIIGRGVARAGMPNAFIQELMRDSQVEDAQWTWRTVRPGRDTMQYTVDRLIVSRRAGYFRDFHIALYQSRIEWTTSSDPAWEGMVLSDSDLPPPHVYAVSIRPPMDYLKLGDALVMYGQPLRGTYSFQDTSSLCFAAGVCVVFKTPASGRLSIGDDVQSISYMTSRIVERSLSDARGDWRGFRRY